MKIQTTFFRSFSRRQSAIFALGIVVMLCLLVPNPQMLHAAGEGIVSSTLGTVAGWAGDGLGLVVRGLLNALLSVLAWLANVAIAIFVTILDPATFSLIMNNDVIYQVWTWVRDVCNLLFIATLLSSAFATIFQIDKYHYRKLLLNVIIMALLVNFSWPISRFIVDFFNSMMYFFVNNLFQTDASKVASELLDGTEIKNIFLGQKNGGDSEDIKMLLVAIIAMFIFAMTVLTLAVLMLVRLVALPIIIMFSPIGFAGSVMPFTASYASKWWDKLFSYASYGPIATFMVLVAVKVLHGTQSLKSNFDGVAANMTSATDRALASPSLLAGMAYFAIPIILFWVAITTAEKTSSEASGMAVKFGTKFSKWTGGLLPRGAMLAGGAGVHYTERKLASTKYGKYLVPKVWKGAWKQRQEAEDRKVFEPATGSMRDTMNDLLSRVEINPLHPFRSMKSVVSAPFRKGMNITDYGYAALQGVKSKYMKELSDVSTESDYVIPELQNAVKVKDTAKVQAALELLAKDNNLNDMMHAIGDKFGKKTKDVSPQNIKLAMADMLRQAGADEETIAKQVMDIGSTAVGSGFIGMAGMAKYDSKEKKFVLVDAEEQSGVASAKVQNYEPQKKQQVLHHNSIFIESPDSDNLGDIHEAGAAILSTFGPQDIKQSERSRTDLQKQFYLRMQNPEKYKNFNDLLNSNPLVKEYAEKMAANYGKRISEDSAKPSGQGGTGGLIDTQTSLAQAKKDRNNGKA